MGRPYIFLRELLDRLWMSLQRRLSNLVDHRHSISKGRARWILRSTGLLVAALAVTQLVPTLADEATPPPNEAVLAEGIEESDSSVVVIVAEEEPTGGDNSPVSLAEEDEITYATTETETIVVPPPIVLADDQAISYRIPTQVKVDPRSVTALLPGLQFSGGETLLLCVQGSGLRFDGASKGFVDDLASDEFIIEGDLTGSLRLSGSYDQVVAYLNSDSGLRAWSNSGAIAGKVMSLSLVALTGVSVDPGFCGQGKVQSVEFRAIGLGMNTKKGGGRLN